MCGHLLRTDTDADYAGLHAAALGLLLPPFWLPTKQILTLICMCMRKAKLKLVILFFKFELQDNQVINNACATQAIVSVLLNCTHQDVHLGETLSEFKEFSQSFDAAMKGLALSNSDVIRQVHNSFARQQMFEFDTKTLAKEEDAFHFVSYVPVNGRLYELDGLREGPIDL
ncbi:hypothetical protein A6R68_21770, partial [Neotoma lepida]